MQRRLIWAAPLLAVAAMVIPAASKAAVAAGSTIDAPGPDMLGTHAVPIRAERFSDSLRRAREDASEFADAAALDRPGSATSRRSANGVRPVAVTSGIRWISDATEWGQHDYWASASQTLAHRAGDAKNRAIVKLHALRALGFSNSDLFLTLARDRVGGPVTVLTVRSGGHYYVMDDTGAPPFLAEYAGSSSSR